MVGRIQALLLAAQVLCGVSFVLWPTTTRPFGVLNPAGSLEPAKASYVRHANERLERRNIIARAMSGDSNKGPSSNLNELHTQLRDAVGAQDFAEAGRISDILLHALHGDVLANGYGSSAERDEKLRFLRKRMSWKGLGAAPWLTSRLDSLNFTFPTTIQINAMEAVNAILASSQGSSDALMEDRIGQSGMANMGVVISGTTGSGKSLAYLVPLLSTLSESLFTRQRIRVGAEEMVGDTTGDLLDRLAIVTSPMVRSTARRQLRSGGSAGDNRIATGASLQTLGQSGQDVKNPLALIVVPSRELGVQIAMVLYQLVGGSIKESPNALMNRANMFKYKGPKGVRIACVLDDEEASYGLKLQTDVAITLPKYLGKLLQDKDVDASKLRVVVYDEADLALEQTPSETLDALFEANAGMDDAKDDDDDEFAREHTRLTYLVGASVTETLGNLAVSSRILPPGHSYIATATRFVPLQSSDGDATATTSDFLLREPQSSLQDLNLCLYPGLNHQRAVIEKGSSGLLVLTRLVRKALQDAAATSNESPPPRVIIFFPNEVEAKAAMEPLRDALWGEHRLCVLLPETGFSPLTILDQFRRNETSVMLATPNSVRGLDVPGLTHVYTLYLPLDDPREYVHLAGRVGRVGQPSDGNVISILREAEAAQMDGLAQQLGFSFTDIDTPDIQAPLFVEDGSSADGDKVESMRRYLEDTVSLLKLADDPAVVDVTDSSTNTPDEDENGVDDQAGGAFQ